MPRLNSVSSFRKTRVKIFMYGDSIIALFMKNVVQVNNLQKLCVHLKIKQKNEFKESDFITQKLFYTKN